QGSQRAASAGQRRAIIGKERRKRLRLGLSEHHFNAARNLCGGRGEHRKSGLPRLCGTAGELSAGVLVHGGRSSTIGLGDCLVSPTLASMNLPRTRTRSGVFFSLFLAARISCPAAEPSRPNFVIIFTDDQGYQDVSCFGSPDIKTRSEEHTSELQ